MRSSLILSTLAGLALTSALPHNVGSRDGPKVNCLKREDVDYILWGYESLVGGYRPEDADLFLTDDFLGSSDSINLVAGLPLGSTTFPTKEAFKTIQTHAPSVPLNITSIDVVTCDFISVKFDITFGSPPETVKGFSSLLTDMVHGEWKIKELFTEFNSATYLKNLGGSYTPPKKPTQ